MKTNPTGFLKLSKPLIILLISCLMTIPTFVVATQTVSDTAVQLTYSFEKPTIEPIDIAGTMYSRVTLRDCTSAGSAGEPKIPSKGAFVLLPPKSKVSSIEINAGEKSVLGTGFCVEPTSQAIPLSQTDNIPIPTPNERIYHTNAAYPGPLYTEVGVYSFRGYQILVIQLHPIQYNPVTGELSYYRSFDVTVNTEQTTQQSALYRGFEVDQQEVLRKVDNPGMVARYQTECTPLPASREQYDLLILTTSSLQSGFVPLQDAHDATGVATVIKTLTDVGSSDLNAIRDYIRDAYLNWGIEYVLIGGDVGVVPAPMLWVSGMDENVTYYSDTMPSDLFFACLDGPYNYDGDSQWGEPNDGEGGGDVDLVAEVYVGRACVDTMADVNNFVTKTVAYINRNPEDPYLSHVLLAAEYLGDYGIASYGSTYMNQLINGSSDDGYTTVGIPTSEYTISTLYDTPSYDWPASALISIINNGIHVINHLGHANEVYNMKMDTSDVDALTNPSNRTCFIYSQGCYAGAFDYSDCIAEHFTVKTSHAAFAGIWNARYGFFWSYSTDGDSQRFHRQFWDAVYGEYIPEIGRANHDSKEDNLPIIGRSCIRWCYYQTNLFGDPTLKIYDAPLPPSVPSGPTSGVIKFNYTYSTSTTDPNDYDVFYQWNWGDEVSSWFGPYESGQIVQAIHQWESPGDYEVSVQAKNVNGLMSGSSESLIVHIGESSKITIGVVTGGLGINAEIRNIGVINATYVNWSINLHGLVFYGNEKSGTLIEIDSNATKMISTGFVLGFGTVDITIAAADVEKSATAFLFGPFAFRVR